MPKIMQINVVYKKGSTGKIVYAIHNHLKTNGYESKVCYGRGQRFLDDAIYTSYGEVYSKVNNLISRITGIPYGGCFVSTRKLIKIIQNESPDIVHLHCINGHFVNVYKLIEYLKNNKIRTVLTLHAEFMHTANCRCSFGCQNWKTGCGNCPNVKKAVNSYFFDKTAKSFELMKKSFLGFENDLVVVGVSDWLLNQAKESPIMENCTFVRIHNGINVSNFIPVNTANLQKRLNLKKSDNIVLWVTSQFSYEKGKDYFLRLVNRMEKDYKFIVVGAPAPSEYYDNVIFLGKIENQQYLSEVYSLANVVINCSRQESYPTVSLEAQCCGTPFVGFDVGGTIETIRESMGEVVKLGDLESFEKAIKKWVNKKHSISKQAVIECREYNSELRMSKEYVEVYNELLINK